MIVKVKSISGFLMTFLGVMTLGAAPLAEWVIERGWPKELDGNGLVTRGGKRIAWNEFTRAVKMTMHLEQEDTLRYDLYSPKGKVVVAGDRLEDSREVLSYIWRCLPETAKSK